MFIRANRKEVGEIVSTTLNISEIRYFEPVEVNEGQPAETRVFMKGDSPREFLLLCTEDELGQAIETTRDWRNKTIPDLTKPNLTMKREYVHTAPHPRFQPGREGRVTEELASRLIDDHPLELWESLSLVNDGIFKHPGHYVLAHCLFDHKEMDLFFGVGTEITAEGLKKVLPFLNSHIYDYFPEGSPDRSYVIQVLGVRAVEITHDANLPYDKRVTVMDLLSLNAGIIWPGMNTVHWLQSGTPDGFVSNIEITGEQPRDLKRGDRRLVVNSPDGPVIYRVETWPQVGRGFELVRYLKKNSRALGLGQNPFALLLVTGKESNGDISVAEEYAVGKRGRLTDGGFHFYDGLVPRGFGSEDKQEETVPENAVRFNHGVMGPTERLQPGETYVLITTENKSGGRHDEIHWSNPLPQPEHLGALLSEIENLPTVKENELSVLEVRLIQVVNYYGSHVLVFDKVAHVDGVLYRNETQVVWEQPNRAIINEQRLYPVTPETMVANYRAVLLCAPPVDNQAPLIAMYRIHEWLTEDTLTELMSQSAGDQKVLILQVDWKGKFFGNGAYNFHCHHNGIAGTVDNNVVSLHPDVSA